MAHAPFAPSAAKRWLSCPGSFALALTHPPEPDSAYAAEGTRLHDLARQCLAPEGCPVELLKDDYHFLRPYLEYAARRIDEADASAVEETIHHSALLFGTPDLLLLEGDPRNGLLEVVDLKCGAGIMVDPVENDQALCYAYMALRRIAEDSGNWPPRVRLTIVQPADEDEPVKSWETTADHVFEWGYKAETTIQAALAGGAPLHPGQHCRFCPAKPTCPALRGEVIEALAAQPQTLTLAGVAQWLDRADRLDAWVTSLREMAHKVASEAVAAGRPGIPGWGLRPKRATRSWADEEAVLAIAKRRKIKIWQDKLLSPAMAEKVHKPLPQELADQIVAVSSGTNLVRLTPGEAQALPELKPEATKTERLLANLDLLKHRR